MAYTLYAEREDISEKLIGTYAAPEEAEAAVLAMEAAGTWPEGHDAILTQPSGLALMYVDGWEEF